MKSLATFLVAFLLVIPSWAIRVSPAQRRAEQRREAFMRRRGSPETTTPTAPAQGNTAPKRNIDYQGSGSQSMPPFSVSGPFIVKWQSAEGIAVIVYRGNGDLVTSGGGTPGAGQIYIPTGGTYYLSIMALGTWRVRVSPQ